ncbi:PREDICTED: formin-like protein 18 [Ipomoea nil]|uniref:formin-like protein 18 n=1 Tax=Ipomoea nil TaxID=35883 RepID=UPI0009015DF5|nr:PREDICTED: formin-like protein 18 [Ipomoea nil]XP_019167762.1 PREDICTED: formin-like protein 18 [Ipomoea nil]
MALFRKFFYRKPPEGLLEIAERVFVFDCCFTSDVLKDGEYDTYMGGIVHKLCQHLHDSSFMVFNFREEESQSQIESILKDYEMTVVNYPHHYENCPILTMEMIHHFLKSSESWLSLGPSNVLLLHCELGGWPVLAFTLAALLIFRKQYTGEQKTLDIIYKQAPRELLQLMLPLNPLPSQLRYLKYVSRRNLGSEWPPLDRALTLDFIILRDIPNADGEGGCRPIFRIYGQDPFMAADRTPKVLFSTPKSHNAVRHYKQADCQLVKIGIHCHVQGDVVLECITVDDELEDEEMVFRVMFNTAFIRSNILMLNRDELDILWDVKDEFPPDFKAEILFSEMNSASTMITPTFLDIDDQGGGLPSEAFAKVREIFSNVDWLDPRTDVALDILEIRAANIIQERLENISPRPVRKDKIIKSASSLTNEVIENFICQSPTDEDIETSFLQLARKLNIGSSTFQDAIEGINLPKSTSKKKFENMFTNSGKSGLLLADLCEEGATDEEGDSFPSPEDTAKLFSKLMANDGEAPKSSQLENDTKPQDRKIPLREPSQSEVTSENESSSNMCSGSSAPNPPPISSLSKFHAGGGSNVGITGLLKENSSSVTMSPRHAILASVPGLLKPLSPNKPLVPAMSSSQLPASQSAAAVSLITSKLASLIPPGSPDPPPPPPPPFAGPPSSDGQDSIKVPETSTAHPPCAPPSSSGKDPVPAASSVPPPPRPCPPPPPPPNAGLDSGHPPPPPAPCPPPPPPSVSSANAVPSAPPPPPPPEGSTTAPPPPPPPIGSTNTPPPPPPPNGSTNTPPPPPPPSGSTNSNAPVPPPPAPFKNGPGGPPAGGGGIPPPPMGAKGGKLQARGGAKNQSKRTPLKPYHWLKITRAMQGSLWAEAQKPEEASKAPEFDMTELESLFSATVPKADAGKSGRRAAGPKTDKVQLIDLRRAYNCEIMLTKVKIPLPDLMSLVLALDDSELDIDQVDNLIKFCPTKEEMEALKNYKGEKENLGKCEQFFLELMKVPRVESKLRVFSFKIQFVSQVSDLRKSLNVVHSTADEVRNSIKLKRVMQTILSLGNAMNHGTARGSAVGFRLDSLLKLTDTRARNSKMTLMHYLCKVLADKLPEVLDFSDDLESLEAASKLQLKYLAEEMQAVSKGLEKIQQELTASENDGHVSECFCTTLKDFLGYAESEVRSLATLYSGVGRNADALALYFGEDPARCPFEQVVLTLLNFVRMFKKAHEENCKQLEFERKKAEKEAAENEKAKLNNSETPKKELGEGKTKMSMGTEQLIQPV